MKLIIGGAFQGKKNFAKALCPDVTFIDGAACAMEDIYTCGGIFHFHEYVRNMMAKGHACSNLAQTILDKNKDIVIVTNELGYGVVPIDAFDRSFRERTGRICTVLASEAEEVYRVICGLGVKIK